MKIMSHNSWTFLKPRTLLGKIFKFTARCQAVNIQEQYENYNVRFFDLRIRLDSDNHITLAHGLFEYGLASLYEDLSYLNSKNEEVFIRVLLEDRNSKHPEQEEWFKNYCKFLEDNYPKIIFVGGNRTCEKTSLYFFKNRFPSILSKYASYANNNKLDDLWPWLYAKINNKKSYKLKSSDEFLSLDFVNEN